MTRNGGSGAFTSLRPAVLGAGRLIGAGLSAASAAPLSKREYDTGAEDDGEGTPLWVLAVASAVLVLLGGAFAGLTIAYVLFSNPSDSCGLSADSYI